MIAQRYFITGKRYSLDRLFCDRNDSMIFCTTFGTKKTHFQYELMPKCTFLQFYQYILEISSILCAQYCDTSCICMMSHDYFFSHIVLLKLLTRRSQYIDTFGQFIMHIVFNCIYLCLLRIILEGTHSHIQVSNLQKSFFT